MNKKFGKSDLLKKKLRSKKNTSKQIRKAKTPLKKCELKSEKWNANQGLQRVLLSVEGFSNQIVEQECVYP